MLRRTLILLAMAMPALCSAAPAAADSIERPISIYVAGTAGGGIDLYARVLARHLGRHIPGKPTITVQLMPGAGGIRAAMHLAEQAPRDGTAIASAQSPFRTIDDVRREQMVVAGTGAGSDTDTWPVLLNTVLGTRFKLVSGYVGTQETVLAIERGEAHGRCVMSYSALKTAKPDWLRERKINVLLLTALERHPDFPGVPTVTELVRNADDRALVELMAGPSAMARPFAAPAGLAPERAALLRRAFDATMADPEFRTDAARIKADLAPSTGVEVQALVQRLYATPRPVLERIKKLLSPS
jgi:tripartite-type tricarboxylate transporter receptor subunit TctC